MSEVLPLLYLHGLSTGDFVPALGQFLDSAAGFGGYPYGGGVSGKRRGREPGRVELVWLVGASTGPG